MAKKKVTAVIKLQCPAQKATPAPPIGPALGPHGVSAPQFVQQFNDKTKGYEPGLILPVIITVYQDKSFTFILKTPPAAVLIKKALGLQTASGTPNKTKVGTLTQAQLTEIAQTKLPDLNAYDIEAAKKIIAGTARSMGVEGRTVLMRSSTKLLKSLYSCLSRRARQSEIQSFFQISSRLRRRSSFSQRVTRLRKLLMPVLLMSVIQISSRKSAQAGWISMLQSQHLT